MNLKSHFDTINILTLGGCIMPDKQNSPMRNWARRVSIDAGIGVHNPQDARGYAGHVAGFQNWAAVTGLDFGRPENQSRHKRSVNQ